MANDWDQLDDFDENSDEGGQEPKKTNPLRKRMRELERENQQLKETNSKLAKETRSSSLVQLLRAAKVKHAPKVAVLVPSDVDSTEDGVKKWLEDYAEVFNIQTEPTGEGGGEGEGTTQEPPEQTEQAEKLGRIGKVTASTATVTKQADLLRRLNDPNLKKEELLQMIYDAGGGPGSG
jgi:hypothetical protein